MPVMGPVSSTGGSSAGEGMRSGAGGRTPRERPACRIQPPPRRGTCARRLGLRPPEPVHPRQGGECSQVAMITNLPFGSSPPERGPQREDAPGAHRGQGRGECASSPIVVYRGASSSAVCGSGVPGVLRFRVNQIKGLRGSVENECVPPANAIRRSAAGGPPRGKAGGTRHP